MTGMSSSAAIKKKHVRFASLEEEEDDDVDDQEEDTLFEKKDAGRGLKSALKAVKNTTEPGCGDRVEVVGGGRGQGACGRWVVTLSLCGSFLGLGMCISVLGPTFEDLALNVNKNISNLSYIFVGRSAGYIGGSLLGGVLFDCMNPHLFLGFSMLLTALGMYAVPFCKQALLLTASMSCIGISMGALDTGGNVLILNTWGGQAGPYMQALHFSFAAGAFASPIIAKLLFGAEAPVGMATAGAPAAGDSTPPSPPSPAHSISSLKSMWAYIVIGSFLLLVSFFFFLLYARGGAGRGQGRGAAPAAGQRPLARHHSALVVLLFFFFFAYVGAEVAYGSFIFTFAKGYARLPPAAAAGLNSLFWGAFAAARGLAIVAAAVVRPGAMILLSLAGSCTSSLLLVLWEGGEEGGGRRGRRRGGEEGGAGLWLCTGLYGASMAATFPSGVSWLEQYTAVSGRTAAAFVVGAALGEMVLPALLAVLIGRFPEEPLLMYLALITSIFTSVLFPVMYKLASPAGGQRRRPFVRRRPDADESEYRQALLDGGVGEEEEEEEEGKKEEEEENEADQWNDADFEVIEMDDAPSPVSSPSRAPPPRRGQRSDSNTPPRGRGGVLRPRPPGGRVPQTQSPTGPEQAEERLSRGGGGGGGHRGSSSG
ncbi:LOW QUALITY PROTEIN: sodium-dependent glucose transporter 1 [Menidia menidia]